MIHIVVSGPYFPPGGNVGPMECLCGWVGVSTQFSAHRRAVKAKNHANGYPLRNEYSYDNVAHTTPVSRWETDWWGA